MSHMSRSASRLLRVGVFGVAVALLYGVLFASAAPPAPGGLISPSHPDPNAFYASRDASFTWDADALPSIIGSLSVSTRSIAIAGTKAYVAGWDSSLHILDISDPSAVHQLGSVSIGDWGNDIAVSGDFVYAAARQAGLKVVDVHDDAHPVVVGSVATSYACDVAVSGDTLFLADYYDIKVFDISNPVAPVRVGTADRPEMMAFGVDVAGDTLYVAAAGQDLQVFDVADPTSPVWLGGDNHDAEASDVEVCGDYAYTTGGDNGGLMVVDVSNPVSPVDVGYLDVPGGCYEVSVWGSTLYVSQANGQGGGSGGDLLVVDVSDPTRPTLVGQRGALAGSYGDEVCGDGPLVGFGHASSHFEMWRAAQPATGTVLGSLPPSDPENFSTAAVAVSGDTAYIGEAGTLTGRVTVVDVSNPAVPAQLSYWNAPYAVGDVAAEGDTLYAATDLGGLQILDVSNPASPAFLGSCDTSWYANGVAISGNTAYVSDYYDGLQVIDVTDPTAATIIGSHDTTESFGVAVDGNILCLANRFDGMEVLDVTTPTAPVVLGTVNPRDNPNDQVWDVAISGDFAFMANDYDGMRVVDISDPTSPTIVATCALPGSCTDVALSGSLLYASAYTGGLTVIDVTNPASPVIVGSTSGVGYTGGVAASGELAFTVSNEYGGAAADPGLHVFDCATGPVAYSYAFDTTSDTVPDTKAETDTPLAAFTAPGTGNYFFHLSAIEHKAWSVSPAEHLRVRVDRSPVAAGESYAIDMDTTLSVSAPGLLANDSDPDGDSLSVTEFSSPAHGKGAIWIDGRIEYRADNGWTGVDRMGYRVQDALGMSVWTTVTISVRAPVTPSPTSLDATLTYGTAYQFAGTLTSQDTSLAGQPVVLETSPDGVTFTASAVTTTTRSDGTFAFAAQKPSRTTWYRAAFAETSVYQDAVSTAAKVTVRPSVGTPKAPSTMYRSHYYTVYGYLKPRHSSGTYPIRIYRYRYVSGHWKSYGYVKAKASNYSSYTKYSVKTSLRYSGRWKVRAYAPADSGHIAAWSSGYDYVTVK